MTQETAQSRCKLGRAAQFLLLLDLSERCLRWQHFALHYVERLRLMILELH